MMQDDADLMRKSRVIGDAIRYRSGHDVAMAVFMLQAFAVERGAARGAAEQEAACLHIACCPSQITDALEAKHRVVHIEGHHDAVAGGVARGCRNPAAHAAGFVDAFLQNLATHILLVIHHLFFIHRGVLLAKWVVNADLAEQAFHAEGTGFVHENRHHALAQRLVAQELREEAHVGLRRRNFAAFGGGFHHGLEHIERRHGEALIGLGAAMRQIAAEGFAPLV